MGRETARSYTVKRWFNKRLEWRKQTHWREQEDILYFSSQFEFIYDGKFRTKERSGALPLSWEMCCKLRGIFCNGKIEGCSLNTV